MIRRSIAFLTLAYCAAAPLLPPTLLAQEAEGEEAPASLWSVRADVGLALTEGNSNTETLNIRANLERRTERALFRLRFEGIKSDTADDRFRQVEPGFTWLPGETPTDFVSTLVDPGIEPDVENYYSEALFERTVSKEVQLRPGTMNWHAGASWERNIDAGLVGRTVLFAGVGHDWWNRDDLQFRSRYGVSYTYRNETTPDPEKDTDFGGLRAAWHYLNRWGPRVIYENDLMVNMSLSDSTDYSANMTQSLNVPMSKRLSLTVGLKWLYNNFPSLEDIDLVAEVILVDPDGEPGSGDEFFQTVSNGGTIVEIGTVRERKKSLDTVISTSLRVSF